MKGLGKCSLESDSSHWHCPSQKRFIVNAFSRDGNELSNSPLAFGIRSKQMSTDGPNDGQFFLEIGQDVGARERGEEGNG